ncbi:MAG: DEAD/DEAH box helicase [Methanosarcinaceae archaeon]|nr:DEAD/DEAH box helicase [Methanosarcinaceae archaeon]
MEQFKKLGICEPILRAIEDERFIKPSEIQEKSIPYILDGRDVVAESATGSGKTLAFGAGILHEIEKGEGIQAIVLTPTRELAEQVASSLRLFGKYQHAKITAIYGGMPMEPQIQRLAKTEIVVGTPGRVLDHINRGTMKLGKVNKLVLDEADTMLDMGFIDDVKKIIRACPHEKQVLLFSATISREVNRLAEKYMKNHVTVSVEAYVDASKLEQIYYQVTDKMKFSLLLHLIKREKSGLIMVFCNTQRNTDFIAKNLQKYDISAVAIHGGLNQSKRTSIMNKFHSAKNDVLVCTDVAARGLDIPEVSHVYNYDIPNESKNYVHRIGRTARAGKDGKAISILTRRDQGFFDQVLRDNDVTIIEEEAGSVPQVEIKWMEKPKDQSRGGRRGGQSGGSGQGGHKRGFGSDGKGRPKRAFGIQDKQTNSSGSGQGSPKRSFGNDGAKSQTGGSGPKRSFGNQSQQSSNGRNSQGEQKSTHRRPRQNKR